MAPRTGWRRRNPYQQRDAPPPSRLQINPPAAPAARVPESFLTSPIFRAEREDMLRRANISSAELRAYLTPEGQVPNGQATRNLQSLLNQNGFKLNIDGVYGPVTDAAYKNFLERRPQVQQEQLEARYAGYAEKRQTENQKILNEAAAARLELKKLADEYAPQVKGNRQAQQTLKQLREMSEDPVRWDNTSVIRALGEIKNAQRLAAEAERPKKKSFFQQVLSGFTGNPITRATLTAISYPQEQIAQAYYSGKQAQLRGAGVPTQARATLAGLPGLGFLAGGQTRRDIEAVNTYEERAKLTEEGRLASFGEFISGRAKDKLRPELARNAGQRQLPTAIRGVVSAGADLGFQVATDPLTAASTGFQSLGRVGQVAGEAGLRAASRRSGAAGLASAGRIARTLGPEAATTAQQAGRVNYILQTKTGQALLDRATKAVASNQDVRSLRRAIRNLPVDVAAEALTTARTQGINAARGKLARAFVDGTWNPNVRVTRQARIGLGGEKVGGAVRLTTNTDRLRRAVRGDTPSPGLVTGQPESRVAFALESSLREVGEFAPDFYARLVQPEVASLGVRARLNRVERLANDVDLGEFSEAVEAELNRVAELYQTTRQRLPVGERGPIVASMEAGLRRLESLAEVMRGAAGPRSLRQAETAIENAGVRRAGLGVNPLRRAGQMALSIAEPMAPPSVRLQGAANPAVAMVNRVESLDRWAAALGADDSTLYAIRRAAEGATSERQLYRIIHDTLIRTAESAGVEADNLIEMLEARVRQQGASRGFALDENGELIRDVQTVSQLVEDIPLLSPEEVAGAIRTLRAEGGARGARIRVGLGNKLPRTRKLLEQGHKAWKFNIVTNAYAPFVGAIAGASQGDTPGDRLENAARGAALGALGAGRYVMRVAGIEENLRKFFERGFTPQEWVPYVSRYARRKGLDLPFVSHDIVRAGNEFGNHLSNRALVSVDSSWVALGRKEPRFVDGWWRIVNYQLHPESDDLARILLEEKAGILRKNRATRQAIKFLETPDGQNLYNRLRGGIGGPKTYDEAIQRYRDFINDYVPEEVALTRLGGQVDRVALKDHLRAGLAPEMIHAQKTWVLPRSARDLFAKVNQLTGKVVLEGPTTRMNRIPLAEWIYHDEFQRLRRNGIDPERAQRIADQFATERTNSVMFQINDESRFAKKVDFVFPFQQPREELLRVWGKLLAKNPGRTFRVVRLAALGFNHAAEQGMFRKDDFTGEWKMAVPGSAYIANRLFGVNVGFSANLRDFLFFGQGAYGINTIPTFGGPYWQTLSRSFINSNPEVYENMDPRLRKLLFPYGASGKLTRNEPNRLWMAFAGTSPPWEFFSKFEQENEIRRWSVEMYLQLKHQHFLDTGETDYEPTDEEVQKAVKSFFKVWVFTGSVFPAVPQPVFPGNEAYKIARLTYTNSITGVFDKNRFMAEQPQFVPFLSKRTEYVGPDDYKHWTRTQEERANDYVLHYSKRLDLSAFREDLKEARETSAAYVERGQAFAIPNPLQREAALQAWRAKHPELAQRTRDVLSRNVDLVRIDSYPASQQPAALDRWRKEYNVSHSQYLRLREQVKTENFSPWRFARGTEDVMKDVAGARRAGIDERAYVSGLAPTEQIRYWQSQIAEMDYFVRKNPQAVLDEYNNATAQISALYRQNPRLRSTKPRTDWDEAVSKWKGDYAKQIGAAYTEIDLLRPAMDAAAQGKDWKTYYALRDKRTALYDSIKALKNKQYLSMPELAEFENEVSALLYFQKPGSTPFVGDGDIEFIPSNEEQRFLTMPEPVQQAYLDDLITALELPNGERGKLFFEWLTTFQQDVLSANLPSEQVDSYRASRPDPEGASTQSQGEGELGYAYAMFKQYSQRPGGAAAPAGYDAYLALPKNPAVRSQFLKANPAVANWIKQGPMANMPQVVRMIVTNIMVKHGKWEGDLATMDEITDLSFAREQLSRWNRREGVSKPGTYDLWMNMPSGAEKATFLKEHPEVQNWIRLGPMANMPEEYKEVVRDIMTRYGEWTQRNDPLGEVINGYYKVPSYARDKYLEDHPELLAYWAATRSPEENAMYALADQYYAMPEQGARRLFLQAHPELQQFFLEARTRRYERFLNKVAQYMGQNPELFTEYLERQEDILAELLGRFGEPNLVKEVPRMAVRGGDTRRAEIRRRAA